MIALVSALALLAAPAADATPSVWIASVSTSGVDGDASSFAERLRTELAGVNAALVAGPLADEACAAELACVGKRATALGAGTALTVRLVRGGPVVQVSIVVVDGAGSEWYRSERILQVTELASSPLLPGDLLTRVARASAPVDEPPPADPPPDSPPPDELPPADPPGPEPGVEGDPSIPVLGVAGLGVLAIGLVGALVGVGIAVASDDILKDPEADGADKENALIGVPAGVAVAIVGGVVALGGAVLAGVGLATAE